MPLPSHVQTVIVGGGIAGCSVAYHLAKLRRTDVLLREQGQPPSRTSWQAAGLAGRYGREFGEPPWLADLIDRYGLTPPPGTR